jgi:hypothetical protein
MELQNIPFNQLLQLSEADGYQYIYAIKFGKFLNNPVDHLAIGELRQRTFGEVKDWQSMHEGGLVLRDYPVALSIFFDKPLPELYALGVVEVCQTVAYLCEQIRNICAVEREALVRKPTIKEVKAGLDRFNRYGSWPQLYSIATTFGKSIQEVRRWSYNECFVILCYQKDYSEYQTDFLKVK